MHLVGQSRLRNAALRRADLGPALAAWRVKVACSAWHDFSELRSDFPSADFVRPYTVFNIRGNRYRLIATVFYAEQVVDVRDVLTHAAYDKGRWR